MLRKPRKPSLFALPPPVTLYVIIGLVVVFVLDYLVFVPEGVKRWSLGYLVLGENPTPGPITKALCLRTSSVLKGQVWRAASSMLLHGGLIHILGNAAALWVAGSLVEREIGPLRYGLVLLASGIFANICVMRVRTNEFGYGASTAIYGAIGVLAALFLQNKARMLAASTWPQRILLLGYVLLNVAADPNTLVEHGSGFICGIALSFWMTERKKESPHEPNP